MLDNYLWPHIGYIGIIIKFSDDVFEITFKMVLAYLKMVISIKSYVAYIVCV